MSGSDGPTLRSRALRMLARRDYARAELQRKLDPHATEADDVGALLDDLQRLGFLSDVRFAEQLAHRHRGRHGPRTVERDLRRRGVTEGVVDTVVAKSRETEFDEARQVLRRRFQQAPVSMEDWARQGRYLQARGFSLDVIRRLLKTPIEDELA